MHGREGGRVDGHAHYLHRGDSLWYLFIYLFKFDNIWNLA